MGTIGVGEFRSHLSEPSIAGEFRFKALKRNLRSLSPRQGRAAGAERPGQTPPRPQ